MIELITFPAFSDHLPGVSRRKAMRWSEEGKMPRFMKLGREPFWEKQAIHVWLAEKYAALGPSPQPSHLADSN